MANIIKLNRPNYYNYNESLANKVIVANNYQINSLDDELLNSSLFSGASDYKKTSQLSSAYYVRGVAGSADLYELLYHRSSSFLWQFGSTDYLDYLESLGKMTGVTAYFNNCIIGKFTGNYRIAQGTDIHLLEVELYLHMWSKATGLVVKTLEVVCTGFNDPSISFITEQEVANLKLDVPFSPSYRCKIRNGNIGYTDEYNKFDWNKTLDPDYLKYSNITEVLTKFGGNLYSNVKPYELSLLSYRTKMDVNTIYSDASEIKINYGYIPSNWIKIQPLMTNINGVPLKIRVLAHKTNPDAQINTAGTIESKWFKNHAPATIPPGTPENMGFEDNPFVAVDNLEPNTSYYFRTYIKYAPMSEDGMSFDIDPLNSLEWYSESVQFTTFSGFNDDILLIGRKWPWYRSSTSLTLGLGWVRGSLNIIDAGLVYCKESEGRAPNINTDPKKSLLNFSSREAEQIEISGLEPGTAYWFKTYIRTADRVIYPQIEKGGNPYVTPGSIVWDGDAIMSTSGLVPLEPKINLDYTFWVESNRFSVALTLKDDGGSFIKQLEITPGVRIENIGVCYSTSPNPDINSLKAYADYDNGTDVKIYYPRAPFDRKYLTVTGLQKEITYYIRAFVVTDWGVGYSDQQTVTTLQQNVRVAQIKTLDSSQITFNSAKIGMIVIDDLDDSVESGIFYKIGIGDPTESNSKIISTVSKNQDFIYLLESLSPGTLYSFRAYFKNSSGKYTYGQTKQFITKTASDIINNIPPTINLYDILDITSTKARAVIKISSVGDVFPSSMGVILDTKTIDTTKNPDDYTTLKFSSNVIVTQNVSVLLGTLLPNKLYYARAFAKSNSNFAYSIEQKMFMTQSAGIPVGNDAIIDLKTINYTSSSITSLVSIPVYKGTIIRTGVAISTSNIINPSGDVESLGLDYAEPPIQFLNNFPTISNYQVTFNNLSDDTTYYYAAYFVVPSGWVWSTSFSQKTTDIPTNIVLTNDPPIITDYTLKLTCYVNDESRITSAGYDWSTDNTSWNSTQLNWASGPIIINFERMILGRYYVRGWVKDNSGRSYTSQSYLLDVKTEPEYVGFNIPINANLGDFYEHSYNGVTRRWKKNKIGWQKVINSGQISSAVPSRSAASVSSGDSASEGEVVPIQTVATVEEKYLQYTNIGATFPQGATLGFAILYLKDAPKFTYDENHTTELLDISILGVPVRVDSLWIYNPSENSIRSTAYLKPIPSDIQEIMDFMNTGGSVAIYPSGKNTYPKELKPSGNALVYGDRILLAGPNKSLDTILTESINYVVTVGCSNYIPEFGEYKYLSPFTDLPPADDMSTYANGYCPISGKISRVVGTFYAEGVKGSGETYPIILEIKSPNIIEYLGDVTVTDGFGKFDLIPLTPITHPGGELTIVVTPVDGTTTSTDIKIVATIFLTW